MVNFARRHPVQITWQRNYAALVFQYVKVLPSRIHAWPQADPIEP